jgi:hypothetical protein
MFVNKQSKLNYFYSTSYNIIISNFMWQDDVFFYQFLTLIKCLTNKNIFSKCLLIVFISVENDFDLLYSIPSLHEFFSLLWQDPLVSFRYWSRISSDR